MSLIALVGVCNALMSPAHKRSLNLFRSFLMMNLSAFTLTHSVATMEVVTGRFANTNNGAPP
jgi:hypothetical protein